MTHDRECVHGKSLQAMCRECWLDIDEAAEAATT